MKEAEFSAMQEMKQEVKYLLFKSETAAADELQTAQTIQNQIISILKKSVAKSTSIPRRENPVEKAVVVIDIDIHPITIAVRKNSKKDVIHPHLHPPVRVILIQPKTVKVLNMRGLDEKKEKNCQYKQHKRFKIKLFLSWKKTSQKVHPFQGENIQTKNPLPKPTVLLLALHQVTMIFFR